MKRVSMNLIFIILLMLALIISGCGSSGGSGVSSDKYVKKVYIIGEIKDPPNGREGSAMKEEFVNRVPYDGVSTDAPIFIDASSLMSISETVQRGIKATYENLNPIVIILPTEADVNRLLEMLGLEKNFRMPDGFSFLNMFAVDLEKGANFRWIMLPPLNTNNNDLEDNDINDQIEMDLAETRIDRFSDWLSENGSRMTEKEIEERQKAVDVLMSATKNSTRGNYKDYVYAENTIFNAIYTYGKVPGQNVLDISFWIYSFHEFATKEDWFYVRQEAKFDSSGTYRSTVNAWTDIGVGYDKKEHYAGKFEMDNYIQLSPDNQNRYIKVLRSSPDTTTDKTEVESGMNWEFTGDVGFNPINPTGNVGLKIDIKDKYKFSIDSGQVYNKSNDSGANTKWFYQFKTVDSIVYFAYLAFLDPSPIQTGMFSPQNHWLWRFAPGMRDSIEGKEFVSKLNAEFIFSTIDPVYQGWFWISQPYHKRFSGEWTKHIPLKYAPILVVDKFIEVTKSAQTKQIDIGVGREWTASCDQSWCKVDPSSGNADTTRVNLTVDENDTHSNRKATITFKTKDGKGTPKTEVYQSQY